MSSQNSNSGKDTCQFGHIIETSNGTSLQNKVRSGGIKDLEELQEKGHGLLDLLGGPDKHLEVSSGSQGMPYTVILVAADKFDDDWGWSVAKTDEQLFISPQSNIHGEFMQRKQQAEQNVKSTMQNLGEMKKKKHMLEHDIRKLRSRVEAIKTGDESQLKGDFIELVDGAGQSARQGGDQMSLKAYRDQNIFPTIVAEFNEMESAEDLEDDGPLSDLPRNVKAILRKKYKMYERWKDLYGSEVERKLDDLKAELRSTEKIIEETKEWLEPYARDLKMINQDNEGELGDDMTEYFTFRGYSTMKREMEFVAYQGVEKHHGALEPSDDPTHYKVYHIHAIHVNIAGGEQPQSSSEGPTVGIVMWRPVFCCKHVFENFFQQKIDRQKNQLNELLKGYRGEFGSERGEEFKEHRQSEGMGVQELRHKVGEEIGEEVPIRFSSAVRRIEDGFEEPEALKEFNYKDDDGNSVDVYDKTLELISMDRPDEDNKSSNGLSPFQKKIRLFTGQTDSYYMEDPGGVIGDMTYDFRFQYYYDLKLGFGLYTMK